MLARSIVTLQAVPGLLMRTRSIVMWLMLCAGGGCSDEAVSDGPSALQRLAGTWR